VNQAVKVRLIATATFKEIVKSKILINVLIFGIFIAVATFVASEFTLGVPSKVATDIGLGILALSANAISLFLGVSLVAKEIESRTIYVIISRPVSRMSFLLGKVLGLSSVLAVNTFLLSSITALTVLALGGTISNLFLWCIGFTFFEALMLLLVVVTFSLVSNQVITIIMSLVVLMAGHATLDILDSHFVKNNPILQPLLKSYHFMLPGFYKLNLRDFVVYNQTLPLDYLFSNLFYGISYCLALIFLSIHLLNRKNLD
jgi:ABC-type transport system involved in multi-copper enzyme maturation permease subunit